jgi:two-component system nitrogen regulation response regulator GlnG
MNLKKPDTIWVIDDDKSIRWVLEKALTQANLQVTSFTNAKGIFSQLEQHCPTVIIADIRMPGLDGITLLEKIHPLYPHIPVIIMTAYSDLDSAVASYQSGAFEYLPKPFDIDEAVELVHRAIQHSRETETITPEIEKGYQSSEIIGSAPAMQTVFRAIGRLSRSHMTVLITGESGTGKELVANALHRHSLRNGHPFIALNTAAIPRELLESELFGHERGSFTGAHSQRQGRFEQANNGSLFLDEIGDMPAELQTRLLRVLADGTFFRVGGHTPVKVDVRIIAATHQNLEQRVREGHFREDLYHRLNVIHIHVPPLRERREDIPLLMKHFLYTAAQELTVEPKVLHPTTERYLLQLDWQGNVRQLENTCRWLTVMASGQEIHPKDLPPTLRLSAITASDTVEDWEHTLQQWAEREITFEGTLLKKALPRFERIMITVALKHTQGHRQSAAKLLGWGRNTLARKIKELAIELPP